MTKSISRNESDVIQLLLEHESCSITELERHLNVTATAVRQRLNGLMAAGLIDRKSVAAGRGRPNFRYLLTESGRKSVGNNLADFASALWEEIQQIPDESVRLSVISGTAKRLAASFADKISGQNLQERLESVAKLFGDRDIPVTVTKDNDGLPLLNILACPYPDLANENHEVCEMERQLFSEVVGGSFELCECRQDGDSCCTYQAETAKR